MDELQEARALAWETAERLNTERDTTRRIVAKLVCLVLQVFDLKAASLLRGLIYLTHPESVPFWNGLVGAQAA